MSTAPTPAGQTRLRDIVAYSTGDGANSLIMNTFFSFAMLYYTKALGMSGTFAGFAIFLIVLWDAVTDPLMGHISDNTRSRFGRRHPYMLVGGVLTVICFYLVWAVPSFFQTPELLFWYLLAMNLLLRTGATVFGVPYIALGFEVCTDYNQRTTLQGVRGGLNMVMNLVGPAILGWSVFLKDRDGVAGSGATIADNYERMGLCFAGIALALMLFMIFATRKYAADSRNHPEVRGNSLGQIVHNLKEILFDPFPRIVFFFMAVHFVGVVVVTTLQMFVYLDFMAFSSTEKTVVHGSTMVAAAVGALLASRMVRRLDKKPAVYALLCTACFGNIMLVLLFATEWVPRDFTWGTVPLPTFDSDAAWLGKLGWTWAAFPVATLVFMFFHGLYHVGSTAATTIANSMMADVSEISRHRTGVLKDGSYSAMLSFVLKAAISVSALICGVVLDLVAEGGAGAQTVSVGRHLMLAAFAGGSVITLLAMLVLARYPVTRSYMAKIQAELAEGEERTEAD